MSERTNWISVLALIGAGLALFLTVILNLCPVCAEKRAGGIDGNEAAKLSENLSKHSLRLAQVEQRVSRLEGQATGAAAPVGTAPAFEPYVWTQLYPDSMLHTGEKNGEPVLEWKTMGSGDMIARAIVAAGQACPTITIGDQAVALVPRELIYPVSFPVTLCETPEVFPGSLAVKLGIGNSLSRSQDPKNILIIGDTGCRITFYTFQNCLYDAFGEGRWPFPRVVDSVLEKDRKIDLIIHVGDYHYRERPCPADQQALCGTANWGYNWASWQADFFAPARKLLAAAPWVFVRGNHENCDRAGTGWTNFLWPTLRDKDFEYCQDFHEPYMLKLADGLSLVVLDIANTESADYYVGRDTKDRADLYNGWMKALATADLEESVWFAMQQPPWQWPTKDGEKPNATEKQEQETAEKKACKETVIKHEKRAGIRDDTVKQIQKYLRARRAPT